MCVWSAGNAPRPLVQQLAAQIPEQVGGQGGVGEEQGRTRAAGEASLAG